MSCIGDEISTAENILSVSLYSSSKKSADGDISIWKILKKSADGDISIWKILRV